MEIAVYTEAALRTLKPLEQEAQLEHCRLGILTEIGELGDSFKRHHIYGKDLDKVNVIEELGDCAYYIVALAKTAGALLEYPQESANLKTISNIGLVFKLGNTWSMLHKGSDLMWISLDFQLRVLSELAQRQGVTFDYVQKINIAKLAKRYGDKYTDQAALIRNLEAEKAVLCGPTS